MRQGEEFDVFNQFLTEEIFGLVEFLLSVLDSQLEVPCMESGTRRQGIFPRQAAAEWRKAWMKEEP